MTNHKHFYAAHSYMGLNYTYDSSCWTLYAFDSKTERDTRIMSTTKIAVTMSLKQYPLKRPVRFAHGSTNITPMRINKGITHSILDVK